jgi:hypothetical protein
MASGCAVLLALPLAASGANRDRGIRDDQLPFGPEGTIGRGTDSGGDRWYRSQTGYRTGGAYSTMAPTSTSTYSTSSASGPYLTTQFHEPGDGYRYPLYYNPATRSYFYYPSRR